MIVSVGYEGRELYEFVAMLTQHRIEVLVDVRLNAVSRKRGFSKAALTEALGRAGIEYQHSPQLGNPQDNRDGFRRGLQSSRTRYLRHLSHGASAALDDVIELARSRRIALLCFEREHTTCHRSCILERAQDQHPALSVLRL